MKPLTNEQRDAFLDSAAMTLYAANDGYTAKVAYNAAEALLAERDRRTSKPEVCTTCYGKLGRQQECYNCGEWPVSCVCIVHNPTA